MNEQVKKQLEAMQGEIAQRINAMSRICAGMTLEEMQNAAFDYKSLLEIVQRRDVRMNAGVLESKWFHDSSAYCTGNSEAISKIGEQK